MKKVNWGYVFVTWAILLVVSFVIGMGFVAVGPMFRENFALTLVPGGIGMSIFVFVVVMLCWLMSAVNGSPSKAMKKFMDEKSKEANFKEYSTFSSSAGIIRIDGEDGRIAYVAKLNPKEFQVVNAKDVTDIKSDYNKDPLGGTRYVYFSFKYNGKQFKIPTFTAESTYSLKSSEVLEGISKADMFAEILKKAAQGTQGAE